MDEITAPWYSVDWFMASTWRGFTWENPVFLYLLAAVPFLFLTGGSFGIILIRNFR
jgi:hypothetical protein